MLQYSHHRQKCATLVRFSSHQGLRNAPHTERATIHRRIPTIFLLFIHFPSQGQDCIHFAFSLLCCNVGKRLVVMSEGGESQQQPPPPAANANNDKPRPKPVMTSTFINKGAKVFAPKVKGRRRPAAATPTTTSQPPASTDSTSASQAQTQPDIRPADAQLPTPQATQESAIQDATHSEQITTSPSTEAVSVPESSSSITPTSVSIQPQTQTSSVVPAADSLRAIQANFTQPIKDTQAAGPRSEVTRTEPLVSDDGNKASPLPTEPTQSRTDSLQKPTPETNGANNTQNAREDTNTSVAPPEVLPEASPVIDQTEHTSNHRSTPAPAAADPIELPNQTLPWTTVNAAQEEGEETGEGAGVTTTKPKPRAKRRKGPVTLRNMDEEEAEEGEEDADYVKPKRKPAKPRSKKRTTEAVPAGDEVTEDATRPTKKPRRTRRGNTTENAEQTTAGDNAPENDATPARPKANRKPRKRTTQSQDGVIEGEPESNGAQAPRRKGRPPREETPSDAENETIDVETTFMGNLAARNIRVGKLSQREKKMREVNWDEIRAKWREDDALGSSRSREEQAEALRKLNEAAQNSGAIQSQGEQLEIGEDGQFRLKATARVIDQGAEADRYFETMETVAEDDLTNRITHKSFLRNNKRHPQEFMLPGQGRRWNLKDTNDFYDALRMFGTDFMMISTLFPGATRRSIKLKFVREERADPDGIREALHGKVNSDWDQYLINSGRQESDFKDPDEIMRELEEEKRSFNEQIAAAKEAAEEERRQRRLAGIDSDAEEAGEKENANGKKKKGKKDKTVQFAEEGVEILGAVDEDDGWGQ
ncbi:unnamed protein product [Periconia digitata]|uniref:Transcription factor TFIIIB component B'' Myb domain-containing protein n=1 Tax=Periconia digitata TaxID=1303443 RepID=A0A9W4UFB6_9PLEO|nr:unnamed protein product [Periconia digitata]